MVVLIFIFLENNILAQHMFPEAEGMGSRSGGAYGGNVLPRIEVVDNMDDSGPGSFRYAVTRPYPRIVVFEISGDIMLNSPVVVRSPYLHVAGQTAPGKGISVWGEPFVVNAPDVLVQDVRFRLGAEHGEQTDCTTVGGSGRRIYNVVFDRCSFAFGLDETFTVLNAGPGITISNSLIAYSLHTLEHSCGMLIMNAFNVSIVRNVFAFNRDRNPNIRGDSEKVEVINNLIYNAGSHAVYLSSRGIKNTPVEVLIEGNLYITGPDNMNRYLLSVNADVADSLTVFWADNKTWHEGQVLNDHTSQVIDLSGRFSPACLRPFEGAVKTRYPSGSLLKTVLPQAGARANDRDFIDSLVVANIHHRTGRIVYHEDELGGALSLPVVREKFQMPEEPHSLAGDGFTNLQVFLQDLLKLNSARL